MKKFLKIAGGVVFLVIAAIAAGFAVIANMDPSDFQPYLNAEIKDATRRDLKIAGDLKISVSLTPTVIANDVTLSNAAWGSRPHMVSLKRLETGLSQMPLLSDSLVVANIELIEPDILLETNDKNPCVAALDKTAQQKANPGSAQPSQQQEEKPSNPVDAVTKGVGGALKSLFGK